MDFFTNLVTRLNGHQHELQGLAGVENVPEIRILLGQLFDVGHEALHGGRLGFSVRGGMPYDVAHDLKLLSDESAG